MLLALTVVVETVKRKTASVFQININDQQRDNSLIALRCSFLVERFLFLFTAASFSFSPSESPRESPSEDSDLHEDGDLHGFSDLHGENKSQGNVDDDELDMMQI